MKCQKCQQETFLPFRCPYCGGYYCTEHRLPEAHQCQQIELARTSPAAQPQYQPQTTTTQKQAPYEYSVTYIPTRPPATRIHFSTKEIEHLTAAALLVVGIGLSLVLFPFINVGIDTAPLQVAIFITILTASFFTHEIAHKIAAQKNGLWAEFRLTLFGAILTLFSIISPIKIISPGAMMVGGMSDIRSMGKISIVGPATNITLATAFLAVANAPSPYQLVFALGAFINAWIALFNLIPFGILDGFKIFIWNKLIWGSAFAASLALTIAAYTLIV